MGKRGGARPNSGPKSRAAKLLEAKGLADWFTPEYQKGKWQALLNCEDLNVQYRAVSYLTDRLYGKAPQALEVLNSGSIEVIKRVVNDL